MITNKTAKALAEVLGGEFFTVYGSSKNVIVFGGEEFHKPAEVMELDYNGLMPLAFEYLGDFSLNKESEDCYQVWVNLVSTGMAATAITAENPIEALALALIEVIGEENN